MKLIVSLMLMLAVAQSTASAQTISFLGQELNTAAPSGFCELGGNEYQDATLKLFKENTGLHLKMIAMWVPCNTIPALNRGDEVIISRWLIANITTPGGKEGLLSFDRHEYMRRMSAKAPGIRLDERIQREKFAVPPRGSDRVAKLLLGPSRDAFFFEMHSQTAAPDGLVWLRSVSAQTVINNIPLTLVAYERTDLEGESSWVSLNGLLQALLSKNPEG